MAKPTGRAPLDLAGQVFGLLTVVRRYAPGIPAKNRIWLCSCACGGSQTAATAHLRLRKVRSCGCLVTGEARAKLRAYNRRVR